MLYACTLPLMVALGWTLRACRDRAVIHALKVEVDRQHAITNSLMQHLDSSALARFLRQPRVVTIPRSAERRGH